MYAIEKNIPIIKPAYPFKSTAVGQSFYASAADSRDVRMKMYRHMLVTNTRFVATTQHDGRVKVTRKK